MKRIVWLVFLALGLCLLIPTEAFAVQWQEIKWPQGAYDARSLIFTGGKFYGVGDKGKVYSGSPDGNSWTSSEIKESDSPQLWLDFQGLAYGNGTFVAVGWTHNATYFLPEGRLYKSTDGASWTRTDEPLKGYISQPCDVTYGNKQFVVVGDRYAVFTSPDGQNWTRHSVSIPLLVDVMYVNSTFIAVGGDGAIATSPDGINWSKRDSGTTKELFGIAYGNNTYVAVGEKGTVLISYDLINWIPQDAGITGLLAGVGFGDGVFVACGFGKTIITSPDGANWTVEQENKDSIGVITTVANGNGLFVLGGSGTFISQTPLKPPVSPENGKAAAVSASQIDLSWADKSNDETGFKLWRKIGSGSYTFLGSLPANTTQYSDTGLEAGTTYAYKICAYNSYGCSTYSTGASAKTPVQISLPVGVKTPTDLTAAAVSTSQIDLSWTDNATNETGYTVWRKVSDAGVYTQIAALGTNASSYSDSGLLPGKTYYYRVKAFNALGESGYSNEASVSLPRLGMLIPPHVIKELPVVSPPPEPGEPPVGPESPSYQDETGSPKQLAVKLYIGSADYTVNGEVFQMDTVPVIRDGRTLLPIRYVAQAIGAAVEWDQVEQRTIITLQDKVVEVWVGSNTAKVNGQNQQIDEQHPGVTPLIVPPGRTMLPLRFVAEKLGCQVDWDQAAQMITVTYQMPVS